MKKPTYNSQWAESWKLSYHYDVLEFFGGTDNLGYTYAFQSRFSQTISAIGRHVLAGANVIDIASAQGNFSLRLAELGYTVTWNDLRAELVDYVKLKYETGTLNYAPGNCFDLGFQAEFDAAIVTEIIEHVAHPDLFLQQIASLVKPGGYIIMTTPNGEYFRNNLPRFSDCADPSVFEEIQFKPDGDGHIFLLHRDEIESLASKADLAVIELKFFTNPLTAGHLKTRHLLRLFPKLVVDFFEGLSATQQGKFLARINSHTLTVLQKPNRPTQNALGFTSHCSANNSVLNKIAL
ncbi:class I SAM-dependent methyltransferase [Myxacorys almedinensis]|uniref:Methyltransferase domain-containing protein n=1 Tax=Myxacorys almedinensis A TaxID=2690445 RepID=A0A8J7Z1S5_9CYAN|nr:methyltransferase domain-containing protein [Myxacorys almedinensis]NDJ16211.1 methyltransferase domain-containing protein [Myxacorys almedinensis A]